MNLKKITLFISALALLGNGCTKISNPTVEINDLETDYTTGTDYALQANRDPYGKAETAFNEVAKTIKPSGKLDPTQKEFSMNDRLTWYEKVQWPKDCEAEYRLSNDREDGGLAFYKVGEKEYVMRVDCYLAAYQKNMLFANVTVDDKNISGKILLNNENYGQYSGFDSFDPANQTLTIYYKARGVGDCGSRDTFSLANGDLELIKTAAFSCEESDAYYLKNPNAETMPEWPVVYEKK